jgi:hypothetical protein
MLPFVPSAQLNGMLITTNADPTLLQASTADIEFLMLTTKKAGRGQFQ